MKKRNLKKIILASLPDLRDFSMLCRGLLFVLVFGTISYLFYYSGAQVNAQEAIVDSNARTGILRGFECDANGGACLTMRSLDGAALARSAGGPDYTQSQTFVLSNNSAAVGNLMYMDYGATGRVINAMSSVYESQITNPSYQIQYYANRVTGKALAADPRSGSNVIFPMYNLSTAMRNLAYSLIVIILVLSSFSILLGYLSGGEQKVTLVQIMINSFMTLVLVSLFYEIAAIVYDLTVNYGNALVASVMEPFINARVILERLQPGGDLNATALLNVFEFAGVSGALNTVFANIMLGARPAIAQSLYGTTDVIANGVPLLGPAFAMMNQISIGGLSMAVNAILSGLLGSQAIFDALIAWTIFFINIKIFGNLLIAYISFMVYVAFGPLLMLQAVNQGYDKIKNVFKTLAAFGLVFPVTFLMILLGATVMNFYYKTGFAGSGQADDMSKTALCAYSTNDPTREEADLYQQGGIMKGANDSPLSFRRENTEFQDIFDTVPGPSLSDGKRNCRSALFPAPFTFLPAPLGNYGNRVVQIQTTDILVRTALGIMFLIVASRVPNLIKELLQVEEMKALQGIGGAFKAGFQPVLALGATGLAMAPKMTMGAASLVGKIPFISDKAKSAIVTNPWFDKVAKAGSGGGFNSISDIYGALTNTTNFHRGIAKTATMDEASRRAVMSNPAFANTYINPDTSNGVKYEEIRNQKDPRVSGFNPDGTPAQQWVRLQGPAIFDPVTKRQLSADEVGSYMGRTGDVAGPEGYDGFDSARFSAGSAIGRRYSDPVIGAQMAGWVTTMGTFQNAVNGSINALQGFNSIIEKVGGSLKSISIDLVDTNF